MSSADNPTEPSVTTGGANANVSSAPRPLIKRRLLLISLIVVVVLLLICGGGRYRYQHRHKTPSVSSTTGQSAVDTAIEQSNNGNTNSALSTLNHAIKNTTDKSQKAVLYTQLGDTYTNDHNYQAALNGYQQAAQTDGLTYGLAQAIAEAAQQAGNKQLAIQYYQKAISLIPLNDPTGEAERHVFQTSINTLEGQ